MAKYTSFAIAYDFDGTLAPGNMPEHSFIPTLNKTKSEFWAEVKQQAKAQDMDEILAYMHLLIKHAKAQDVPVTKKCIIDHGKGLQLFPGASDYFDRITEYGRERQVKIDHFIISSGLREIIQGTEIAKKFKAIFASGFLYDVHDVAIGPAIAVNYTTKTQFLFRISKGIHNCWDNAGVNKFITESERPVPFSNMIYLGDGETDVPCMKMMKLRGGSAIAVYDQTKRASRIRTSPKQVAEKLIEEDRADYAVPADYSEGGNLDTLIKALIDRSVAQGIADKYRKVSSRKRRSRERLKPSDDTEAVEEDFAETAEPPQSE